MGLFDYGGQNINIKYGPVRIRDVGEKVGSLFGEKGRKIGKAIDDLTKNVDIDLTPKKRGK